MKMSQRKLKVVSNAEKPFFYPEKDIFELCSKHNIVDAKWQVLVIFRYLQIININCLRANKAMGTINYRT